MKEKLKKLLAMARKQMAPLICGTIVVIAVVLCYWPTQGWFTALSDKVSTSIALDSSIQTLLKHERHLPNLSLDSNATPPVLEYYPTDPVYQMGKSAVAALGNQSQDLLQKAADLNNHIPLYPGALPAGSDLDRASFASKYKDEMNGDHRILNWPPPELASSIPPLKAGRRISEQDVTAAAQTIQNNINLRFPPTLPNGEPNTDNVAQGKAEFEHETKDLALKLELAAARTCRVYMEPGAFKAPPVYTNFLQATSALSADDVWSAQLALWIDEDVATAVARANVDAKDVTDAPVKQILEVAVKDPPYLISGDPTAGKEDQPLTPVPDMSPSGRVCNGMYDVVQFSLGVDVDATRVPAVMDALQHGQFITILTAQQQAVDGYERAAQRFVYGSNPVVHLDLVCEELLLHSWISKYQPPDAGPAKYATGGGPSAQSNLITVTVHSGP